MHRNEDSTRSSSLSLPQRLLYAGGHFGVSALTLVVLQWAIYFYKGSPKAGLPCRVDPMLFTIALLVGRLIDAFADPLVGFWSDRTRTRWGRRKPFIALGILPLTLFFVLIWWTPEAPIASSPLGMDDLKDPAGLATKLGKASDPLSQYLRGRFSEEAQRQLEEYDVSGPPSEALQRALVGELNRLRQGDLLYEEQRFAQVELTEEIQTQIKDEPQGEALLCLNRLLLEEAYPHEIAKSSQVSVVNFVYLLVVLTGFFFAFTIVTCPYLALLPEIVQSDQERVGLSALQAVFNVLGNIAGATAAGLLIEHVGFVGMGLVLGGVSALTFALACLGPKERHMAASTVAPLGLRQALVQTFANKPFRHFGGGFLPFWIGLSIVLAAIPLFVKELLQGSEAQAGLLTGVALITAVLSFPLTTRVVARKGKRWVFLTSMTWFILVMPFLGTVGRWPLPLSSFGQAVILMILAGPALGGLLVLPYAILADITDYDEQITGQRREAMYFGVQAFLSKAGMGLGPACANLIFTFLGSTAAQPWGLYLSGVFAAAFTGIGLLIFWGYRLDSPS
jgi:GPH family glycoside/pentoside/hexuronide:cation symporter